MAISAAERAFRQAQSNISKPNAPVAVARYVPSYASQAAQKRQTVQNLQAPGVPAATPGLPSRSSGGDGGGSQNIQAPAPSQQPSAPQPLNWRDAAYNAQIASIQRALQDFETGATTRGERYGQDFMTGLRGLGYRPAEGFQAIIQRALLNHENQQQRKF